MGWIKLLFLFRALPKIATELRIIRELYEQELYERMKIVRQTEKPSRKDTEVVWNGEEKPKVPFWKRIDWEPDGPEDDREDIENVFSDDNRT